MKDFLIVSAFYHVIGDFWTSIVNTIIMILFIFIFSVMEFETHYGLTQSWMFSGLLVTLVLLIQSAWIWFNKDQILANENSDQRWVDDAANKFFNRD